MEKLVYINTIGFEILIDMGESIVGADEIELRVIKPDGTVVTDWANPAVYNTRYIRYVTIDGDLDQSGVYQIHPSFTLSGWSGSAKVVSFRVYPLAT